MNEIRFLWDPNKSRSNQKKHSVSFEEAETAFFDEKALLFSDPDHSEDEDRFLMLGLSFKLRMLLVCHCFWQDDSVIRIISARRATKKEAERYREGT